MREGPVRQNLWELAVLAFLRERPMHPYEMQRLLRERHKDELLILKRGSLYHAVNRLLRLLLIETVGSGQDGRRPVRTTYRITPTGAEALTEWIQGMIAGPVQESSEFMAALSFLVYLTPKAAIPRLEARMQWLERNTAEIDKSTAGLAPLIGRINLIETEYLSAMRKAELAWIRDLVSELRTGHLSWDLKTVLRDAEVAKRLPARPKKKGKV